MRTKPNRTEVSKKLSAIEYLLNTHMAVEQVRTLAIAAGVDPDKVRAEYEGRSRINGWAAEYVKAAGVGRVWKDVQGRLQWGGRALFDFPVIEDISMGKIRTAFAEVSEDRRMWIELDKFRHKLPASAKAVIFRRADASSVIRRARLPLRRASQPLSNIRWASAAPREPARWWRCSLQSTQ